MVALRAALQTLDAKRIKPVRVAGHSLGEYTALTAAGVIPFEEGAALVAYRGMVMQEACEETPSRLVRLIGLTEEDAEAFCRETNSHIALTNAPNLIVVGTTLDNVSAIEQAARAKGIRAGRLSTSGAFHTPFMRTAQEKLGRFLSHIPFSPAETPVVGNLTGEALTDPDELKHDLEEGMIRPVLWSASLKNIQQHVQGFIEVGPGNSLTTLNTRFNGIPTENSQHIQELLAA